MTSHTKKKSLTKKILFGLLVLIVLAGVAFHIFITRYLPPLVQQRLSSIIVKGSDSLYKFEVGKFDVSFWGGAVYVTDLHITTDSTRYRQMEERMRLPPMTISLSLPQVAIKGIDLWALIFSKKIIIKDINFLSADVKLARHFRTTDTVAVNGKPLWKLIQPDIHSVSIKNINCADLKVNYQNVDSVKAFHWQFDKCNVAITDIQVDSLAATDSTRLVFAKNIAITADDVEMKTPDGLYQLASRNIMYTSASRTMELNDFSFLPSVTDQQFKKYFGYEHEIYRIKIPSIRLQNFLLPQWINKNKLEIDTILLASPSVKMSLDRNMPDNRLSKKGKYPHQLLQKAPFGITVKQLNIINGSLAYTETNDKTALTGQLVFPSLQGTIINITNDSAAIASSSECVARIHGSVMKTGRLQSVFRFNLADKNGAFILHSTITNINAPQMQALFKAMTATDIQSFNMKRLDYSLTGNEDRGIGNLQMQYDEMDILINQIEPDKSLDKKGLLSFFANRLAIYPENPFKGEERKAMNVVVRRDETRSFFNLIWKTLFTSSGEIVLRPLAKRKIEKRKHRNN